VSDRLHSAGETKHVELLEAERSAVQSSVTNSIDLYARYVTLRPEDPQMARKQGQKRRQLGLLRTALTKLKGAK
jgi:hypothetical protein